MMRRLLAGSFAALALAVASVPTVLAQRAPARPSVSTSVAPGTPVPVRIMTYNVENWRYTFLPRKALAATRPGLPADLVEVAKNARAAADEENWEVARVIQGIKPDVWVMQEGCDAEDLNYFNTQFLDGYFETVHIFKTNTERGQNTGILIKPGFKVLEFREDYLNDPDVPEVNPYSDKLFSRGPGFAKIKAPNGTEFWVGTNHAKSKSGNSEAVAKWRLEEAKRTNTIIADLRKTGPKPIFFLGDMNDELGYQEFELTVGSAIEATAGKGENGLLLLTKSLSDSGAISYHGGRRSMFRSFIDHAFATPEAGKWVKNVSVYTEDLADVASDHYPVVIDAMIP